MAGAPKRMSLTNVEVAETLPMLFNPEEVELSQAANYTRHGIPTLSFQPLGYEFTSNVSFSADIVVDGLADVAIATNFVANLEAFLAAAVHPPDDADTLGSAEPPRILLVWPGWLSLVTKLMKWKAKVKRFALPPADPTPNYIVYSVEFEESRRLGIGMESVRQVGFKRG